MNRRLILFSFVISLLLFVSCSNNDSGSSNSEDEKEKTIRMAWWGNQPRHDYTIELIKLFEDKNPDIKIEYEYAGWDDYWQGLAPQAAANELPDIIQMSTQYIAEYVDKKQILDLTTYFDKEIDISDLSENFILAGEIDDGIYGLPTGTNVMSFMYDPNMLEKIGIDSLPESWTWDDYISLSNKAVEEGLTFDVGIGSIHIFNYYLRTHGKSLFDDDGNRLGYENDQLFIDFFSMAKDRVDAEATPTPDYMSQLTGQEEYPVIEGEGVGAFSWSSVSYGLEESLGSSVKLAPMPGPNTADGLFLHPTMYFSIAENSKYKKAAARFIDFYTNDIEANEIISAERGVPGSMKVLEILNEKLSGIQQENIEYVMWAEDNSQPMGTVSPPRAGQIDDLIDDLYEEIIYEVVTVEEAASKFREEAESILN